MGLCEKLIHWKMVEDVVGRGPQAACLKCLGGASVLEEHQQPQNLVHCAETTEPTESKNSKRKHPLYQESTSATTETSPGEEK